MKEDIDKLIKELSSIHFSHPSTALQVGKAITYLYLLKDSLPLENVYNENNPNNT
jgi:hypothetical protein